MERACLDRRCRPFVPYLPYNPCHPVFRCRLCTPGYQIGLYPLFVPALRAALARHFVRAVQSGPALLVLVLLAVALSGNRHIATGPRLNRYQYTMLSSFNSPLQFCSTLNAASAAHGPRWGNITCVAPLSAAPYCNGRKSTRLNSSHANISYAVFCLKKNKI